MLIILTSLSVTQVDILCRMRIFGGNKAANFLTTPQIFLGEPNLQTRGSLVP